LRDAQWRIGSQIARKLDAPHTPQAAPHGLKQRLALPPYTYV